jgi:hypothetical protein
VVNVPLAILADHPIVSVQASVLTCSQVCHRHHGSHQFKRVLQAYKQRVKKKKLDNKTPALRELERVDERKMKSEGLKQS